MEHIIEVKHLTKEYKQLKAVDDLSFEVREGEILGLLGPNGSGKSTTINCILSLLNFSSGSIRIFGSEMKPDAYEIKRKIGVVFQDFRLLKDRNVYENVAFAQRIIQKSNKEIKKNVPSILAIVGLAGKYKAKPKQLSGGEQQRVALARALVNEPTVLLADEPTGNLDPKNSWEIMKLLEQINENGTTVLVVTHNREIVNAMQKRVVTLKKGVIVSDEEKGGYIDED